MKVIFPRMIRKSLHFAPFIVQKPGRGHAKAEIEVQVLVKGPIFKMPHAILWSAVSRSTKARRWHRRKAMARRADSDRVPAQRADGITKRSDTALSDSRLMRISRRSKRCRRSRSLPLPPHSIRIPRANGGLCVFLQTATNRNRTRLVLSREFSLAVCTRPVHALGVF